MIGMPPDMVEPLQVVKYSQGQKFETHHDMGTLGEENQIEKEKKLKKCKKKIKKSSRHTTPWELWVEESTVKFFPPRNLKIFF